LLDFRYKTRLAYCKRFNIENDQVRTKG